MSENSVNENYRSPLTRKIGAGLTRTSLSPRSGAPVPRLSKDTPLLTPSRLIISGSNLSAQRTQSDRLASGYDRLGGSKYVSAPNVNAGSKSRSSVDAIKPFQKDDDVNQSRESPIRRDLSDKSKFLSLQDDPLVVTTSVQRSQSANRGHAYPVTERPSRSWYGDTSTTPRKTSDQPHHRTKLENFDLDLEQDEEDAENLKVKDTEYNVSPPYSPGKDSGYYSPRLETNVDSFNTSVQRSRSLGKSEGLTIISSEMTPDNFKTAPERPARPKTSARKQSVESAKQLSPLTPKQSPWQQDQNSPAVNSVVDIENYVPRNSISSVNETENLSCSSKDSQRSGDQGEEDQTSSPVARPRSHRRLTRRAFSFRRLVRLVKVPNISLNNRIYSQSKSEGCRLLKR